MMPNILKELKKYSKHSILVATTSYIIIPHNSPQIKKIFYLINLIKDKEDFGRKKINFNNLKTILEGIEGEEFLLPKYNYTFDILPFNFENFYVSISPINNIFFEAYTLLHTLEIEFHEKKEFQEKLIKPLQALLTISNQVLRKLDINSKYEYYNLAENPDYLGVSEIDEEEIILILNDYDLELSNFQNFITDIKHCEVGKCLIRDHTKFILKAYEVLDSINNYAISFLKNSGLWEYVVNKITETSNGILFQYLKRAGFQIDSQSDHIVSAYNQLDFITTIDINQKCYIKLIVDSSHDVENHDYKFSNNLNSINTSYKEEICNLIKQSNKEEKQSIKSIFVYINFTGEKIFNYSTHHLVTDLGLFLIFLRNKIPTPLHLFRIVEKLEIVQKIYSKNFINSILNLEECLTVNGNYIFEDDYISLNVLLENLNLSLINDSLQHDMQFIDIGDCCNLKSFLTIRESYSPFFRPFHKTLTGHGYDLKTIVKALICLNEFKNPVWILPDQTKEIEEKQIQTYDQVAKAICYWIWQSKDLFHDSFNKISKPITIYYSLEEIYDESCIMKLDENSCDSPYKIHATDSRIYIRIPKSFNRQLLRNDNKAELDLFEMLILALQKLFLENNVLITNNEIETYLSNFTLGNQKTINIFDSNKNPLLMPLTTHVNLRKICFILVENLRNEILSDLNNEQEFQNLINQLKQNINDRSLKQSVISYILKSILERINKQILSFQKKIILEKFLFLNENLLQQRMFKFRTSPLTAETYINIIEFAKFQKDEEANYDSLGVAIRFLIEVFYSTKLKEEKSNVTEEQIDQLISLSVLYHQYGLISDGIRSKIGTINFSFVNNKLRMEDNFSELSSFREEKFIDSTIEIANIIHTNPETIFGVLNETLQKEFSLGVEEEYGFNHKDVLQLVNTILVDSINHNKDIVRINRKKFIKYLKQSRINNLKNLEIFFEKFSMPQRQSFTQIPDGFMPNDLYPWIHKRRLSFNKRPFLKIDKDSFWFTPRHMKWSITRIIEDLKEYNVNQEHYSSPKLKSYLNKVGDLKGKFFEKTAHEIMNLIFHNKDRYLIAKSVEIGINGRFLYQQDLGDLDVVIFDKEKFITILVECKAFQTSRTISEIAIEKNKLIEKQQINKHMARYEWVKNNFTDFLKEFNLDTENNWLVYPCFVTSQILPVPILEDFQMKFFSITQLKRLGELFVEEFKKS